MAGFGALLLAGKLGLKARAVAVSSPALFTSAGGTPAGAFDDAADFAENDVYGNPGWMAGIPLRIDCGQQDPFYAATRTYADRLPGNPQTWFPGGGHDDAHWRAAAGPALRFLAARL